MKNSLYSIYSDSQNVSFLYKDSCYTKSDIDKKISLLLEQFKDFFTCLKEDDGKEPYIYDKIMNVSLVLDKKIKDVNYISGIINVTGNDYLDGSVSFTNEDSDYMNIEYGADKHYNKIDWSKDLDKNSGSFCKIISNCSRVIFNFLSNSSY